MNTLQTLSTTAVVEKMTITRMQVIANRTNSFECGLLKSMMIENLKTKLRQGVAHFFYAKKDGSIREAWGTIQSNIASAKVNGKGVSRENFYTCAYWDVEKGEWRSFRWETLIKVC